ncbi:hypothetical protein EV363DRAFT_1452462 [Boletus edulis]|nr:hypothetical protein EV363DRAFT_1452462 [Boletus edulis]
MLSADFTQQCLSSLKNAGLAASDAFQHGDPPLLHANFNLQTPIPLLREWAKATLAIRGSKIYNLRDSV